MNTTGYFDFRKQFPDRVQIKSDWIMRALSNPIRKEVQMDGRIRVWCRIEEAGRKYLRVVLLPDGETVHNAFFDRNFKE